MMSSNPKAPPVFNPDEGDAYENWKVDVNVWQLFTKDEKKRQGPAVYLSLKGARNAVCALKPAELAEDDGIEKIIETLDKVFQSDESTRAYHAFKEYVEYRRSSGVNYSNFIIDYDKRYREIQKYKMELPTGAQAYFMLQAANLPADLEKLARATAKLEYEDMKDKLQKVFCDSEQIESGDTIPTKDESCFQAAAAAAAAGYDGFPESEDCLMTRGGGFMKFRGKSHGRGRAGKAGWNGQRKKKTNNPTDASG